MRQEHLLWDEALKWSPEQWKVELPKLMPDQISSVLLAASPEHDPIHWKEKICSALTNLSERQQLESFGRALSIPQTLAVMESILVNQNGLQNKLPPLLVGMAQQVFRSFVSLATPELLAILKQEAMTEAVQHHLTLLSHELMTELEAFNTALGVQMKEIEGMAPEEIGRKDIARISRTFELFSISGMQIMGEANRALGIAWHTNRTDIIEKLSRIKEQCQRCLSQSVGHPRKEADEPTGLWKEFEKKLNSVFQEINSLGQMDALLDDEPAIEALVKFLVWYARDYWEIGLLPQIDTEELLELKPETHSEKERLEYRETLFQTAESNLHRLGLSTLADLKHHQIYSKKALREYIREHSAMIKSK